MKNNKVKLWAVILVGILFIVTINVAMFGGIYKEEIDHRTREVLDGTNVLLEDKPEPVMLEIGYHYPAFPGIIKYDNEVLLEKAKMQGYTIRLVKSEAGCKNHLPDNGCKGRDYIPPVYEFLNAKNEGEFLGTLKRLYYYNDRFKMNFKTEGYWFSVSCPLQPGYENICFVNFVPQKEIDDESAIIIINEEFSKLTGSELDIIFHEGYIPPSLL